MIWNFLKNETDLSFTFKFGFSNKSLIISILLFSTAIFNIELLKNNHLKFHSNKK